MATLLKTLRAEGRLKLILSRKGFDGAAGGCPSPIIEGLQLSLPIPTKMPTATRFRDLNGPYAELVTDLTRGRYTGEDWCHADPDVDENILARKPGWRVALGQVSSAQGHLANQGVGIGDVFIFWGLFREVERDSRWRYTGLPGHRI